jgi:hypothetical protein
MDEETAGTATAHPGTAPLHALTLRRITEWASGVREKDLWFVVNPHPTMPWKSGIRLFERPPRPGVDYDAHETVIPVRTGAVNPGRPGVEYGWLGPDEDRAVDLTQVRAPDGTCHAADAVFWSESSIEKFVVPYYASKHGHVADKAIRDVLRVLHRPGRPRADGEAAAWGPGDPFALVHIPTSEYLPATEGGVDEETALAHGEFLAARISRTDAGQVEWISLADLAKEQEKEEG